ncbi:efflux RND transporter periplasmic adaptor subunit [Lachnospiraceae bacterium ZAX-1]
MNKKKIGIIIAIAVVVLAVAGGIWYFLRNGGTGGGSSADKVYVESVKSILKGNAGVSNRYSGVIEPQETQEVKKNEDKTVKKLFVAAGDAVEVGTPLFEYDTEDLTSQLAQAKLDLEGIDNEISNYNNQINELSTERNAASADEKFQYTTQIQSTQNSIKQAEINKEGKAIEIKKIEESIENNVVASEIAGMVKTISESGYDPNTGDSLPYITILATGDYRAKGTINEQNIWTISEGQAVILRSRIDETQTWTGSIFKIDTENQVTNNNNGYAMSDGSGGEAAAKYPFYITIDSVDGLILGQHVFIEMGEGQAEEAKEGIWLYESYLVREEEKAYVWAANNKNRLEKREVTLGEYNENEFSYEITAGLTEDDLITFPMPALYEGVATVTDSAEVDYTSPLYQEEGGAPQEGAIEDEDGMMEDGDILQEESIEGEEGVIEGEGVILPEDTTNTDFEESAPEEAGPVGREGSQ